jgi:Family of unknown function (DUF5519)
MQLLGFLARYFAWVQRVFPWAPAIFDAMLMLWTLTVTPRRFMVQERLWNQILDLTGVSETSHRYGGREAVFQGRELCHIHGNGVLDFILPKGVDVPKALNTHIHPHHVYPNSRWRTIVVDRTLDALAVISLLNTIREQRCIQGSFADTDAIGDAV